MGIVVVTLQWLWSHFALVQLLVLLLAFLATIHQLGIRARAHLLDVYRQAITMMDGIREDRHYVATIKREETYKDEHWLDKSECDKNEDWKKHRESAEKVFRHCDQLGLLVREGRIPVNVVARFYVRPILQAWDHLRPYIIEVRKKRPQPSHGWEFEHLVHHIILPGMEHNRGVWKGVEEHEFPSLSAENIPRGAEHPRRLLERVRRDEGGDLFYKPGDNVWEISWRTRPWL
ncbi:MAG TPA: DUF4760 domain-containing protein [Terriglobia bacterium]|nr:DUF4760 domain-containing protein [Terriglobia bacterium]